MDTNNEEILEKLYELGTGQREIISAQQQFMAAQLQLIAGQAELLLLFRELGERLLREASVVGDAPEEQWISKKTAMEEVLFVSERTFYRDYELHKWPRKKLGKRWYYLKSAMLGMGL